VGKESEPGQFAVHGDQPTGGCGLDGLSHPFIRDRQEAHACNNLHVSDPQLDQLADPGPGEQAEE
jgi:hypothetical protein